ncbi:Inactive TPR repeat-containing thioredoxin TTL3 [Linum perenne]
MAETQDPSPDKKSGCGLLSAVFGKKGGGIWLRRGTSTGSIPTIVPAADTDKPPHSLGKSPSFTKRKKNSDESRIQNTNKSLMNGSYQRPSIHPHQHLKIPPPLHHMNNQIVKEHPTAIIARTAATTEEAATTTNNLNGKKVLKEAISISGELESMINDHQKNTVNNHLVRASSGNVMLYGNLGNLRQQQGDYEVVNTMTKAQNGRYPNNSLMGNVVTTGYHSQTPPTSLCRALSTRMDPEQLKIMGNEDYKNGNFAEALALYEAAIAIDPTKASYRSNKSAALTALGRILDAVFECREAIRIEPNYHRAHHRLANLYLRLGDVEKSIYHYKHAGPEADHVDISKAKALQLYLNKCTEARRMRDWNTLIKETDAAISSGADSAPHIYALQAEALMKQNKHQEADEAMNRSPNIDADTCTKFFGPIGSANIFTVRSQVDMAMGRFDEALAVAQRATILDSNNREANTAMRKARAVATARGKGNQLFKAGKFQEASAAYGEGLVHDPHNSVLLCNRAACLSKLGQFQKAVEDCTSALNVRPAYAKARLRRADCYSKLENWEASKADYEILHKKSPNDEEVSQRLLEVKARMRK